MTERERTTTIMFLIGVVLSTVGSYALFGLRGLGCEALLFGVLFLLAALLGRTG